MSEFHHRRALLQAGLALGASLVVPAARACEYFTSTLRITHPWTRATGPDTTAIVCMKFDEVTETDRLIAVETPVAEGARLVGHQADTGIDLLIPEGREILLSEEAAHIRLMGLRHPLLIARIYPLTLVFEKSGSINVKLNVDYLRLPVPSHGGHHAPFSRVGSGRD